MHQKQNPQLQRTGFRCYAWTEVKFVHPVSPDGSVKFVASGANFSIFNNFLCFFLLKLLKLGEIDGVKFLAQKNGGVKFLTNSMSGQNSGETDLFTLIHKSMPKILGHFLIFLFLRYIF